MRLARRVWFAMALSALLGAGTAQAQTGSVSGTVTDESGAAVPGAEVRVDGTRIHTSADERGERA